MSEVISFRLDARNSREAKALKVLACHQEQGYSVRHILTEALLSFEHTNAEHGMKSQMEQLLRAMTEIKGQLERLPPGSAQQVGQPATLSDAFVVSVKSVAKPGITLEN